MHPIIFLWAHPRSISTATAPDRDYTLPANATLFDASFEAGSNTAAVYAEIGVYENDGKTIDDDMIGVWSGTFLLEDLFNRGKQYDWQRLDETRWRLSVTDYPVYDARYLETTVEIGTGNTADQIAHNRERLNHPSALVSFHMDLELGDMDYHADFETDLSPDPVPAFDMDQLNMTVLSSAAPSGSSLALRIIGEQNGSLVTENKTTATGLGRAFDVYAVSGGAGDTAPVVTHRFRIPDDMTYDSANLNNVAQAFSKQNMLSASLARNGDFLLVLQRYDGGELADSGRVLAIDLRGDEPALTATWRPARDYHPLRMAVDTNGETVYISMRAEGIDIHVTTLTDDGLFENTMENNGIPFTVVSMTPLGEGELLIRSCDGVAAGSENLGGGFFTTDDYDFSKQRAQALMLARTDTAGNTLTITDYLSLEDYTQFLSDYTLAKPDYTGPYTSSDSRIVFPYSSNLGVAVNVERSDGSLRLSDIRDSNEMSLEEGRWATNRIGKPYPDPEYPLTVSERLPFIFKKTLSIFNWPASLFNVYQDGDIRFLESSDSIGEFIYYSANPRYLIALSGFTNNMLKPVDCSNAFSDCSLSVIDLFYDENGGGDPGGDPTAINQINTLKGEAASCNGCLPSGVLYARSDMIYVQIDAVNGLYMYNPANDYGYHDTYLGEYSYMYQATDISVYGDDFIIGYGGYIDDGSGNTITTGGVDLINEQESLLINLGTWNWIMDIVQKPEIVFLAEKDHGVGVYDKNTGGVPAMAFYDDPSVWAIEYGPTNIDNSLTVLTRTINFAGDPQGYVKVITFDGNNTLTETRSLGLTAMIPDCLETYGNYAYVGTSAGGGTIQVVNLSPAVPVLLTPVSMNEAPSQLIIASNGNYMYARCGTYIQEFSLANPAAPEPTRIWEPSPDHLLMHMALSPDGTKAYVSDFESKSGPAVVRVLNLELPSK